MNLYRQIAGAVFVIAVLLAGARTSPAAAQAAAPAKSADNADCRVENVDNKGWQAQQISNRWVQLVIVPQNGGRLMQVSFNRHAYLFVNPKFAGKYMPPSQDQWFNYRRKEDRHACIGHSNDIAATRTLLFNGHHCSDSDHGFGNLVRISFLASLLLPADGIRFELV